MDLKNLRDNFLIDYAKRTDGPYTMYNKHFHQSMELYFLLEGERYYFINNRTYHIKKGDLVLINKNILHRTIDTDNPAHERILINFNTDFIKRFLKEINKEINLLNCFQKNQPILCVDLEKQIWVQNHLYKILQEFKQKKEGYISSLKIYLLELLIFLNRESMINTNSTALYADETHEKMAAITDYINQNYHNEISLSDLASKFNYSPSYLSKTFKDVTGFNFVEYKNNVRVKEAQRLLQETDKNISEIATLVGYTNLTHFGRVFKGISSYSPLKYRKLFQK
ncbi:AraC family transcriptional regulator [Natronospora cellulosivora (SeqCode)]